MQNHIVALLNEDENWIYEEDKLQDLVMGFFYRIYSSSNIPDCSFQTHYSFPCILEEDLAVISSGISLEEMKKALFSMQNLKAPGPDGYHPLFFKSRWNTVGHSLHNFVLDCFSQPSKILDVNQTLLTLIPKCDDPSKVSQFRPVALCNFVYKVITKIIAQRLRLILPYVVSENQSSFTPGRSIIDNILWLQETIHFLRYLKGKKGYMILKLDLEKVYDRL